MPDALTFRVVPRPFDGIVQHRKTQVYAVDSTKTGSTVADIKWNHGLKGYCLYPRKGTAWNRVMLSEVVEFLRAQSWQLKARVPAKESA